MSDVDDDTEDLYYLDKYGASGNCQDPSKYEDVIEIYGPAMSSCGYCGVNGARGPRRRRVFDVRALKLTAHVYQKLLDRNWRRSGEYCYYPFNKDTCCPNYGISCDATKFELTKSQIDCIDKVSSFLINGSVREKVKLSKVLDDPPKTTWKRDINYIKDNFDKLKQSLKARDKRFVASCERHMRLHGLNLEQAIQAIRGKSRNNRGKSQLTLEDRLYLRKHNLNPTYLNDLKPKHKLQIRLVHVDSEESKGIREKEHEVIVKYQAAIHKEPPEDWSMSRFENFLVDSPIRTEPLQDRDYCSLEENPAPSSKSVDVFSDRSDEFALVKPPQLPTHFGTYHCLYLLDDELIAVGVIDFLPKCLTTVYFFYDPKYSNLNLGIYSALVEVSIVQQMFSHYQGPSDKNILKHYYMGFYVHQSKKMHYKTSFKPSYLLCPLTRHYVPVETCLQILKETKYARFDLHNEPEPIGLPLGDLFQIPVSAPVLQDSTKLLDYFRWLRINTNHGDVEQLVDSFLVQYTVAVGPELLSQILVKLDPIHRALVERHQELMAHRAAQRG